MQDMSPIQGRQAPTNQSMTYGLHTDPWAPPERLNCLKNMCTLGTVLRTHRTTTCRKHASSGAHRGSANPTGRSNRPCGAHSGASTWWLLFGPSLHPGSVCSHSTPVLRPINRRGDGSFLTNTPYYSSLTFASKARR
jgi:hypothetical protein